METGILHIKPDIEQALKDRESDLHKTSDEIADMMLREAMLSGENGIDKPEGE